MVFIIHILCNVIWLKIIKFYINYIAFLNISSALSDHTKKKQSKGWNWNKCDNTIISIFKGFDLYKKQKFHLRHFLKLRECSQMFESIINNRKLV